MNRQTDLFFICPMYLSFNKQRCIIVINQITNKGEKMLIKAKKLSVLAWAIQQLFSVSPSYWVWHWEIACHFYIMFREVQPGE